MKFTKYLPFENYIITTKLSTLEVLHRIKDNIEPKQGLSFVSFNRKYLKPYTGEISGLSFTMSRNIDYRNSFIPVITGDIVTYPGQTRIRIQMRLYVIVLAFISFWLGTVGLVCMGILITGLLKIKQILQTGFSPKILIPFFMFAFGHLLTIMAFKYEAKKSTQFLSDLLESTGIN